MEETYRIGVVQLADAGYTPTQLSLRELKELATYRMAYTNKATAGIIASQGSVRIVMEQLREAADDLERYLEAMVKLEGELT